MDDQITLLHGGLLGTRKLASVWATLILRNNGALNSYLPPGQSRKGKWTPQEHKHAKELRVRGLSFSQIGAVLKRNKGSVHAKIMRGAA